MTEEEAKKALFDLHYEYMMHGPNERLELYEEYKSKRAEIKKQLTLLMVERHTKELQEKSLGK